MRFRTLMMGGVSVPFLYFASHPAAVLLNPGYDLARQQPSELGCCQANLPIVANVGFIASASFRVHFVMLARKLRGVHSLGLRIAHGRALYRVVPRKHKRRSRSSFGPRAADLGRR